MKKMIKSTVALIMGAMLTMSFQCGKSEDPEPLNTNYNAHHSECLSHTDNDTKGVYSPDSVSVSYDVASQRLHVTHHNLMVNCGTAEIDGGITVSATRIGQTIDIYEYEDESNPQADCMCDVDNEFDLHSIEHGTYTLVFHSCYPDPQSFTFTF